VDEAIANVGSAALFDHRVRRRVWLLVGFASVCVALVAILPPALDNIHVVAPDTVYRSAQLSPQRLEELIASHHLQAVLNLRGAHPGSSWYDDEFATTTRLGVQHTDFKLSAVHDVSPLVAEQLVQLMERMPKPLLVHCQAGADRSGLASALYRYAVMHDAAEDADRQLTLFYGHVPFFGSETDAMDRSFWSYVHSHPHPPFRPSTKGGRIHEQAGEENC